MPREREGSRTLDQVSEMYGSKVVILVGQFGIIWVVDVLV